VATKTDLPPVPSSLADVALIDGPTAAAAGAMSLSSWHELVRVGAAPKPAIRAPRCTRWRLVDVRQFLINRASSGADGAASAEVLAKAKRASSRARSPEAVAKAHATRARNIAARTA
jgi:hypothetical protein